MSFSPSFARKSAVVAVLALLAGCGPKDGVKEFEQGMAAYELHDLPKAERFFEESLACAAQDVDRILFLARVKIELGRLPEAKELVSRAVALAGSDTDVRLLAAQTAFYVKDYKAAAAGFGAIANDASLDADVRSQGFAGLGIVEYCRENPHLARVAFLRALLLDRQNAAAYYHLGLIYRDNLGYLEMARDQFAMFAHWADKTSPRVRKVQGTMIPALDDMIAHSRADRPGATRRNSDACGTALLKAEAAMKKGTVKAARQAYQEALSADPLSYKAALGLAKAWEKGDATNDGLKKAFENYRLACVLNPSAISTFLTAGSLALKLKQYAQAVEIYSRAVAANPVSTEALNGLIDALQKAGKPKVAQAYRAYRDSIPARSTPAKKK